MRNIKKIFIVVFSLILLFAVSCSNDDKTGINNNPPEDTEITDGETETPTSPSEPETIEEIEAKDFPPELFGTYRDDKVFEESGNDADRDTEVSLLGQEIWIKGNQMRHKKDGSTGIQVMDMRIKKWKKTTKGGKIIKLEGESFTKTFDKEKNEETIVAKTIITFDYEKKTVSVTFTTYTPDGVDGSFYGKKIN